MATTGMTISSGPEPVYNQLTETVSALLREHDERLIVQTLLLCAADLTHNSPRYDDHDVNHLATFFRLAAAGQGDPSNPTPDVHAALDRQFRGISG